MECVGGMTLRWKKTEKLAPPSTSGHFHFKIRFGDDENWIYYYYFIILTESDERISADMNGGYERRMDDLDNFISLEV